MSNRCFAFLPYIECDRFTFGKITLTPYSDPEGIPEDSLPVLSKCFERHVDSFGKSLKVVLVGHEGRFVLEESEFTGAVERELFDTVNFLCLLSNWRMTGVGGPLVSDNFELFIRTFDPERASSAGPEAVSRGGYLRQNVIYLGDKAKDIRFVRPDYVTRWSPIFHSEAWRQDEKFFDAADLALKQAYETPWFRKTVRAIKIANTSLQNTEALDYFDRVLILVTAFQTLLDLKSDKGRVFADGVADLLRLGEENPEREYIRAFVRKLYGIRSRYSHGKEMRESDYFDSEFGEFFWVGRALFGLCVRATLVSQGYGRIGFNAIFPVHQAIRCSKTARENRKRIAKAEANISDGHEP